MRLKFVPAEVGPLEETFGVAEVAAYLHISPRTLNRRTKSGLIHGFFNGKTTVYTRPQIQAYVDSLRAGLAVGEVSL